jgi:hypothetical protein
MDDIESVRAASKDGVNPRFLERRAEGLPQWVMATQKQRECVQEMPLNDGEKLPQLVRWDISVIVPTAQLLQRVDGFRATDEKTINHLSSLVD